MIEYIYLVKCPDRTEEPFDFFDEAKDFAIGCLSNNPIITQIEVDRNDFGECTDSRDLGTIWSWEDMVKDTEAEPAVSVFTKDDFADYVPETDPEFAALDNTVEFEPDPNNFRKPIPDGMTIKDLVEEMEENEDTVECTWCEDLFDKDECRYELNLGWLCSRCQAAIMSRGETLTFRENNYWDFLDEDTSSKDDLVTESVTLTEAAIYKYPYLAQQPDAVEQLINGLHGYEGLDYYINADCTVKSAPLVYPGGWRNELKSFELLSDGNIRLNTVRRDGQPCVDYLQSALEGLQRSCRGHRILMAIRDVASELERQYTPSLAVRRNISVEQALNDNKDTAKEIINHITNIKFRIPLGTYDTGDVDKNGDPLTDEACDKLERIKDGFLSYRFSDSAVDLGMVEDRTPSEDYTHNITHCWNGVGIITLDCPVNSLSAEAQALIKESQFKKDPEESVEGAAEDTSVATKKAKSNPNTICCYRLACEIIKFADNKPELFKKPEKLVASLKLEELEDADTYRERLTLCPECGGATTFDDETGMCINCGFNTLTEDVASDKIDAACKEKVDLDYSNIEVTGMSAKRDADDWDEWTELRDFVYTVDKQDIIETLFDYVQEEDVASIGGLKAFEELSDDDAWLYMIDHFDELFEKYEQQLLKHYEDSAAEAAQEDYYERSAWE